MLLLLWTACTGTADKESAPALTVPVLSHTPPSAGQDGVALTLEVSATDPQAIATISLNYRTTGAAWWAQASLAPGEGDVWSLEVDADDVDAPSLEYWFEATDGASVPSRASLPAGGEADPYVVPVALPGQLLPFEEDFESETGAVDLSALSWGSSALGWRAAPWTNSTAQFHGGSAAAYHPRGGDKGELMTDWLITPPLDFSTASEVAVSWYEYGSGSSAGHHGLFASTVSPDPADGTYVPVMELLDNPPDGAWGRAAYVDLSALAGQPVVWLAWYYEGQQADDWWLDDVYVGSMRADLSLVDLIVDPEPIHPGETGELRVTLSNLTSVGGDALNVAVEFPEGGASVVPTAQDLGPLAGDGAAQAVFALTIDSTVPEPSYVPVRVTADLDGQLYTFEDELLVGVASRALVSWQPLTDGTTSITLGVGDPDSPTWEQRIFSGTATDPLVLEVDISEQRDLLPPSTGDFRWFLVVDGVVTGILDSFSIEHLGVTYQGPSIEPTYSGQEAVFFLPEKPEFSLVDSDTNPGTLSPGDTGVQVSARVENEGAETQGPLVATLVSTDADLIVVDGGPVTVRDGLVAAGERVEIDGFFSVEISPNHTDSTPLTAELQLTDGSDSWVLPLTFEVPWPLLKITTVIIDDSGRDGRVDPGESAELTFEVTNVGGRDCSGTVTATLSVEGSSAALAAVATNSESFSTLYVGTSRESNDPWEMVVDASAVAGQEIELLLTLTDSDHSYEARTTVAVSEPPWTAISRTDDPVGDHQSGGFDFVNGQYRVLDDMIELRLIADAPYDPATVHVEAWGTSTGGDYTYYRILVQSGIGVLQGYRSGFEGLEDLTVSYPDSVTVQVDVPIEPLGLFYDSLSLGFAASWCGKALGYYCDHFPDNWGYPYTSMDTASWFTLTW